MRMKITPRQLDIFFTSKEILLQHAAQRNQASSIIFLKKKKP